MFWLMSVKRKRRVRGGDETSVYFLQPIRPWAPSETLLVIIRFLGFVEWMSGRENEQRDAYMRKRVLTCCQAGRSAGKDIFFAGVSVMMWSISATREYWESVLCHHTLGFFWLIMHLPSTLPLQPVAPPPRLQCSGLKEKSAVMSSPQMRWRGQVWPPDSPAHLSPYSAFSETLSTAFTPTFSSSCHHLCIAFKLFCTKYCR